MKAHLFLTLACAICLSHAASAAVVVDTETVVESGGSEGDAYTPSFIAGGPSSSDVLEGFAPSSFSGNDTASGTGGMAVLTDGSIDNFWGNGTENDYHTSYIGGGNGRVQVATYFLGDLYEIDEIVIFGGWGDAGRDEQEVDVMYSTDGTTFISLNATLEGNDGSSAPINHRNAITDDSGILATDVVALRFDFIPAENGWSGYTEIDVFGSVLNVPGDADGDLDVDIDDFIMISDNFLSVPSSIGADGDVNYDNIVDYRDFHRWRAANAAASTTSVPEPVSITLVGICAAAGLSAVRRRS